MNKWLTLLVSFRVVLGMISSTIQALPGFFDVIRRLPGYPPVGAAQAVAVRLQRSSYQLAQQMT